jgi:CRISPR-associated protein Csm2
MNRYRKGPESAAGSVELPDGTPDEWTEAERVEDFVRKAERAGEFLKNQDMNTNKLRKFWTGMTEARQLLDRSRAGDNAADRCLVKLELLDPKLAYDIGRLEYKEQKARSGLEKLRAAYREALKGVRNSADRDKALRNVFEYFEAVVAYHRFHGGK